MDTQLIWSVVANSAGGIATVVFCAALKSVCRAAVKWRSSRLPEGPTRNRASEELQSLLLELTPPERARLTIDLLLNARALKNGFIDSVIENAETSQWSRCVDRLTFNGFRGTRSRCAIAVHFTDRTIATVVFDRGTSFKKVDKLYNDLVDALDHDLCQTSVLRCLDDLLKPFAGRGHVRVEKHLD